MLRLNLLATGAACLALFLSLPTRADVPPPPVNQDIGMEDIEIGDLTEADCRVCHPTGVPDRHHGLYNTPVPDPSLVPYPQFNTPDGAGGFLYSCLSCHSDNFVLERDCLVCHNAGSPHHTTPAAQAGDCVSCHGDLVDNMDDGHYIPSYAPSLVTPDTGDEGTGEPLNSRDTNAGGCAYCHDDDGLPTPVILTHRGTHHYVRDSGSFPCSWCHDFGLPDEEQIRVCEGCHGPAGKGNPGAKFPALSGQHAKYVEIQLNAFKTGERDNDVAKMMRNTAANMDAQEIKAVASYIQGLH